MFKSPLLKSVVIITLLLISQSSFAQIKISKINQADGVKTVVKNGTTTDITINEDGTVKQNFVVELDIAAFRAAYKYDHVSIIYHKNEDNNYREDHEFESLLNSKKYGNKGIIPFYVYNTKNFKETDFRVLTQNSVLCEGEKEFKIAIYGHYITGEEGYFDRNDRYQTRKLLSQRELITYIDITPNFAPSQLEAYNRKQADKAYASTQYQLRKNEEFFRDRILSTIESNRAPVVDTPIYLALSNGYKEVWNAKVKEVKEYDKLETAVTFYSKVKELEEMYTIMINSIQKNKENLKALNKEIKGLTTTEQKWNYIKSL